MQKSFIFFKKRQQRNSPPPVLPCDETVIGTIKLMITFSFRKCHQVLFLGQCQCHRTKEVFGSQYRTHHRRMPQRQPPSQHNRILSFSFFPSFSKKFLLSQKPFSYLLDFLHFYRCFQCNLHHLCKAVLSFLGRGTFFCNQVVRNRHQSQCTFTCILCRQI